MRKLIFNLHLYTALIAGIFVMVLGVTGSIIAFEDDLDRLFNPELLKVTPTGEAIPPSAASAALSALYPGQPLGPLLLPPRPDAPYSVRFKRTQVFLDPYTGKLLGTREMPSVLQAIHTTHLSLMIGPIGKTVVMIIGVILVWLVGSGIYLWWPRKRAAIKFSASFRRVAYDWHNTIGIYSAIFLLTAGLTGIVIHYDEPISKWLNESSGAKDSVRMVPSTPQDGVASIGIDQAVQAAAQALPTATPVVVSSPTTATGSYYVALRFPEDLTPGGRSRVIIDQYSGKPLFVESSRDAPLGTWAVLIQNRAIHTGDILGYPSKIVMSLSCLLLIGQAVTGYYMWWKKGRRLYDRPATEMADAAE